VDHVPRLTKAILDGTWRPLSKEALTSPVWPTHGKLLEAQAELQLLLQTSAIGGRAHIFQGNCIPAFRMFVHIGPTRLTWNCMRFEGLGLE